MVSLIIYFDSVSQEYKDELVSHSNDLSCFFGRICPFLKKKKRYAKRIISCKYI